MRGIATGVSGLNGAIGGGKRSGSVKATGRGATGSRVRLGGQRTTPKNRRRRHATATGVTGAGGRPGARAAAIAGVAVATPPSIPRVASVAVRVRGAGGGVFDLESPGVTVPGGVFPRGAPFSVGGRLGRPRNRGLGALDAR